MTPATRASLEAAIEGLAANLADLAANPKVSYNIDGESYSWNEYWDKLTNNLIALQKQLNADTPVWRKSRNNC